MIKQVSVRLFFECTQFTDFFLSALWRNILWFIDFCRSGSICLCLELQTKSFTLWPLRWNILHMYTLLKVKKSKKVFENYFVYGNLRIFNACDPLTGTLVVEQTEMWLLEWPEIYHERARCGGGQEVAQKRGEINARPPSTMLDSSSISSKLNGPLIYPLVFN